eukprot:6167633-Alexandrium_andersonii.AAC.1
MTSLVRRNLLEKRHRTHPSTAFGPIQRPSTLPACAGRRQKHDDSSATAIRPTECGLEQFPACPG